MKILIADDDSLICRVLKEMLEPLGECDVVNDGREAVQAFRLAWQDNSPYDLLCLDIMMPEMDGHEALQEIRKIEEKMSINLTADEVKVMMVSALDDPKNVVHAFAKGGATSYIAKPISQDLLLGKIKEMGLTD